VLIGVVVHAVEQVIVMADTEAAGAEALETGAGGRHVSAGGEEGELEIVAAVERRSTIFLLSMTWPREASLACRRTASAETVICSAAAPISSATSMRSSDWTSRVTPVLTKALRGSGAASAGGAMCEVMGGRRKRRLTLVGVQDLWQSL
jgi:hypothetical protein